jgi:hypothetical protein
MAIDIPAAVISVRYWIIPVPECLGPLFWYWIGSPYFGIGLGPLIPVPDWSIEIPALGSVRYRWSQINPAMHCSTTASFVNYR